MALTERAATSSRGPHENVLIEYIRLTMTTPLRETNSSTAFRGGFPTGWGAFVGSFCAAPGASAAASSNDRGISTRRTIIIVGSFLVLRPRICPVQRLRP